MPKVEKLPSGRYRIRVYDKTTNSRKSFTADTKAEVKLLAVEWENGIGSRTTPQKITLAEAVKEYIDSKENVLSPSTVRGYDTIYRKTLGQLGKMRLTDITEKDLQKWVSENAKKYKPKGIRNQFGLVTATLRQNKIALDLQSIKLPERIRYEPLIPTKEQIAQILTIVEGTNVELPVTIAVTLGLRQSEIAALKWSDYDGQHIFVHAAIVKDRNNKNVEKNTTKSKAGTRILDVDTVLKQRLDRAERTSDHISTMPPSSVLKRFQQLCKRNGLPRFTMHGQRHGNASLMLASGVPDKYAMERLGQSSPNMIKNVYQHLYDAKRKEVSRTMDSVFNEILDTKLDTQTKDPRK